MKQIVLFGIYSYIIINILTLIDTAYFDFSFLSNIKYILLISLASILMLYVYINSIVIKINPATKSIYAMLVIILIPGTFFSVDTAESISRGIIAFLTFIIIFFSVGLIGAEILVQKIYRFLLMIAVFVTLSTDFLLYIGDTRLFSMENLKGYFLNANTFGAIVGLYLLPIMLLELTKKKKIYLRIFYIFIFLNLMLLFWLIRSRSALLSFVIIITIIGYYKYMIFHKKNLYGLVIIFTIFTVGSISLFLNKGAIDYLATYFIKHEELTSDNIYSSRAQLWIDRANGISQRPLGGWGYGINSIHYNENINKKTGNLKTEKGNSYLAIVEEFGLFFGALIIIQVGIIVFNLIKKINRNRQSNLILFSIAIIFGGLVNVNFESWLLYYGNISAFLFWFVLVAVLNIPNEKVLV